MAANDWGVDDRVGARINAKWGPGQGKEAKEPGIKHANGRGANGSGEGG